MRIEQVAEICHEANRAYCNSIGDYSQQPWPQSPDWQRQSAINGVKFHLSMEVTTPEDSHANWLKEKLENGWRYGPVKDADKKEHPCCVPYDQLPEEQKVKDFIFRGIIVAVKRFIQE